MLTMETTPSGAYVLRGQRQVRFPDEPPLGPHIGDCELLHRIGSGGMGEVFLVAAPSSSGPGRPLALKRLLPELADDEQMQVRFADEARLATRLRHPNLVTAVDVSRAHHDGFFTMEFVDGQTLSGLVRSAQRAGVEIPLEATVQIVLEVAKALEYVHELRGSDGRPMGVVHCDVSPSNILVTSRGDVRLIDFGIAQGRHMAAPVRDRSRALGTLAYMSPEQCRAESVDHRSDVYSLGIILWELTTLSRLFRGKRDEVVTRISASDVPLPSDVRKGYPSDLEAVVLRALRPQPDYRFASARRFASVLDRFIRRNGRGSGDDALTRLVGALDPDRHRARGGSSCGA
jgi:serine/threonine-protein kinase